MIPGLGGRLGSRGGAAAWSPLDLGSTLKLWLRGDLGITLNGGDVSAWADQSGNGQHFTQATGAQQPLYVASGISSMPSVAFTAANNDFLASTGFPALTAGHVFIVMQSIADPPPGHPDLGGLWLFDDTGANDSHIPFSDGNVYDCFGTTVRKTTVNPAPSFTSPRIYAVKSAANVWANYLDGVLLWDLGGGSNTVSFPATPRLGRSQNVYHNGSIAEVILCDAVQSAGNETDILDYLGARYTITVP
jgi:hypothetical protein